MAFNDSPDNEFDQEMESILQEHFEAEGPDLRAPGDPWGWLESRLEEPAAPPFFSRLLGFLNPVRDGRLSPAFAVAGVAVVAIAVAAVAFLVFAGIGGEEENGGLAVVQVTETPSEGLSEPATPLPATDRSQSGSRDDGGPSASTSRRDIAAAPTAVPGPAASGAPVSASTPAVVTEEAESGRAEVVAVPRATAAPYATIAPHIAAPPPMAIEEEAEAASPDGRAAPLAPITARPRGDRPSDTTFQRYGRAEYVETEADSVSTFSLDTDRTSYQLALNWARNGYDVDPDSVRAEEWINAFDYRYSQPEDSGSFSITTDVFRHPLDSSKHMARIGFQAPQVLDATPLNVTLVLDASGSMADGNRVDIARQAAESIRRSLREEDRIAVVHFTDTVIHHHTVEHRPPNDSWVTHSISQLSPHGSTNVQAGLNLGVTLADEVRERRPDAYNYIILMSDGVANVDATDPFAILGSAPDQNTRNPLRIITIGVGIQNYNDVLLEQLAQYGNGWYRYLDNAEQARATFSRDNWLALTSPFADQARAQVTWDPGVVRAWRIVGYANRATSDQSFTQERKEFAEIYSGSATTVFYELELWGEAKGAGVADLGSVELRWTDPPTGRPWRQRARLSGHPATGFTRVGDELLRFGAIVALASDLYSGLPEFQREEITQLNGDLFVLMDLLSSLQGRLGELQSYNDFYFLLKHLTKAVDDLHVELQSGSDSGTGYSN